MPSTFCSDKERRYRTIRQHANAFAGTFLQLAIEARQTRGIKNVRLEFGEYPQTRRVTSKINDALSSIIVTLPDPITTLKLDRLDVHDPMYYATTAMAIHETSHLIFGSLDHCVLEHDDQYYKLALNVVLDICDERTLVQGIAPGAAVPLGVCNNLLFQNETADDKVGVPASVTVAKLLVSQHTPYVEDTNRLLSVFRGNQLAGDEIEKKVGIKIANKLSTIVGGLLYAVLRDAEGDDDRLHVVPIMARRAASTWECIEEAAAQIADILRDLDNKNPQQNAHQRSTPDDTPDTTEEQESIGLLDSKLPDDAMQEMKESLVQKLRKEKGGSTKVLDGGNEKVENKLVLREPHRFNQHRAAMRRLMQQLLKSRKLVPCIPAPRGSIVRDVARAYTDGRIFLKREEVESTNAAIAFILDCSISTFSFVEKMLMFCGCLAEGAREAGASIACWLFGTECRPIATKLLYRIAHPDMGGTVLSTPLKQAYDWLELHDDSYQKRVCVILTDGQPYEEDKPVVKGIHDKHPGIRTLVGCVEGVDLEEFVTSTMPNATSFVVRKDFAVSAMIIAKRIEKARPYGA